jgi:hypothetical protein
VIILATLLSRYLLGAKDKNIPIIGNIPLKMAAIIFEP